MVFPSHDPKETLADTTLILAFNLVKVIKSFEAESNVEILESICPCIPPETPSKWPNSVDVISDTAIT